jgi:hypothetical protein
MKSTVLHIILYNYESTIFMISTKYSIYESDILRRKQGAVSLHAIMSTLEKRIPVALFYTLDNILIGPVPIWPLSI